MHESVIRFVERQLLIEDVQQKDVLEVGSYDVNGSARPLVCSYVPRSYTGIDMRQGPGVDLVCDFALPGFVMPPGAPTSEFDLVLCLEMLEHVEDWQHVILNLLGALKPGGLLLLTTRSYGFPQHGYPDDYWRFSPADMHAIFAGLLVDVHVEQDPQVPGVFVSARKPLRTIHDVRPYAMARKM